MMDRKNGTEKHPNETWHRLKRDSASATVHGSQSVGEGGIMDELMTAMEKALFYCHNASTQDEASYRFDELLASLFDWRTHVRAEQERDRQQRVTFGSAIEQAEIAATNADRGEG